MGALKQFGNNNRDAGKRISEHGDAEANTVSMHTETMANMTHNTRQAKQWIGNKETTKSMTQENSSPTEETGPGEHRSRAEGTHTREHQR